MPKKPTVVKTYGRHKYRTVRAQIWLSPDDDFRSPFGDPARFPSKIESASSTNIFKPKSSKWSKPLKTKPASQASSHNQKYGTTFKDQDKSWLFDQSEKENNEPDPSERKLKRKRQNLFTNCTPVSAVKSTRHSRLDNSRNLSVNQPEVVLVNDTLESSISKDEGNSRVYEVIHIEDSEENISLGCKSSNVLDVTNSTGGSPSQCVSLDENAVLQNSALSFKNSEVNHSENKDCAYVYNSNLNTQNSSSKMALGFDRCHSSYVTSTPVFDVNTSQTIGVTCKSDSQSSFLEGKVVLEPLRITPIQWEKITSSFTEKPHSQNSIQSLPSEDRNSQSEVLKSSGTSTSVKSSVDLKECVVSLEKLRITPLKHRSKYLMATMSGDGCVSHREKSQLSFVEALTPAKKNKTKLSIDEKEEVELSAFDKVMLECNQEEPVKFTEFLDASLLKSCVKIGEGVYGEVFRAQYENGQSIALKIIPIEGDFEVNGEPQKSFEEILPEIVISKELSLLGDVDENDEPLDNISTSFITVHSVTCCRDKYPSHLISEWERWNKEHTSENDNPDIFPKDQYFIVFEFSNGGKDLESFEFNALSEAWSVLHQTALGLAVAENALEFEHRDLHWGNVLISRTGDELIESALLGEKKMVASHGVRVSLIDFTLSRLKKDGVTVFCNLAEDESLFKGKGDYQFDVYRLMKKTNENDWEPFEPHTNALWLHYLADKMLKKKKYPGKDKEIETKLKRFLRQARKCSSATEIVQDFFD